MSASTLSIVSATGRDRDAERRQIDARLTSRGGAAVRVDLAVRDLTHDGFDAETPRPFTGSDLYDVAFRTDTGWSVRLRVRVVESQWLAVRGQSVYYLTRFQFVHADAPSTHAVIDAARGH